MSQCKKTKLKILTFLKVLVTYYLFILIRKEVYINFLFVVMSVIFCSHSRPSLRITRLNFHLIS